MIPALSIRQPWAWLIVNGHKDIENRDWPTNFRGKLLVHAGQTMARRYYDSTCEELLHAGLLPDSMPAYEVLERGGFVGWTRVVDCLLEHPSPWKQDGTHGFVLRDSRPIPFVAWKGRLGFFNVPKETVPT
ncbi:ASCH domain-containing protein [Acidovorax sp. SUPP2825]|uniref:ASCH domain-containing protein n=1 Tax=Acidovorax sp. SUPP2825 TaxID=2920879 RepID=UPI0023DE2FEB|nr:ASCH domain-containing protein [Acidovorax sp. SUPP2825]GKS96915.1 ASCH domain-containing protein [Acidovorax sp. SUPP2825]